MTPIAQQVVPQSSDEMLSGPPDPELIMLAGKDGVGKSSAIVTQAKIIEEMYPEATFYGIDTENKFVSALRAYGSDAPRNIKLYRCASMNDVTFSVREILKKAKPGDWLFVESLSRVWEYAQDLAYKSIAGVSKIEWLEMDKGDRTKTGVERKGSPIPNPDDFWNIAKHAHEGEFFTPLIQSDLNCIFTTTVKPIRDFGNVKESKDRKATRVELGIDVGLDGAPRIPYYIKTMCLLELEHGNVTCRILRDNLSTKEVTRMEFPVATKRDWALEFFGNCRG